MTKTHSELNAIDRLLWIDSVAGLTVGVTVLALSGWLSGLYGLPESLLAFLGCANVAYGSYSGSLAIRTRRGRRWILALVLANAAWAGFCVGLSVYVASSARPLGIALLLLEAVFVGGLAWLEWRFRERLITAPGV